MKQWIISITISLLLACAVVIATYSILGKPEDGTTYLRAGSLELELVRTGLDYCVPNDSGYLERVVLSEETDFTDSTEEGIFGKGGSTALVPGSYLDATMELRNRGTVAVAYRIELRATGERNALAEQLTVTLRSADGTVTSFPLAELPDGAILLEGSMGANESSQSFGLRIEFPDRSDNNAAKGAMAGLDFLITATQATAEKKDLPLYIQ